MTRTNCTTDVVSVVNFIEWWSFAYSTVPLFDYTVYVTRTWQCTVPCALNKQKNTPVLFLGWLSDCNFSFRCDVFMIHSEQGTENILSRCALCIRTNHHNSFDNMIYSLTTFSMKRYKLNVFEIRSFVVCWALSCFPGNTIHNM